MSNDPAPPAADSALEAQVGRRLWGPPEAVERAGEPRAAGLRYGALGLLLAAVVSITMAAAQAGPGSYDAATALMVVGVILAILAAWAFYRATRQGSFTLGIYERGVFLPRSFESAPGIATMGGPVFIRRADVDRVEEMRAGGERAVVVWSKAGRSGIVSARPEGSRLTAGEADALIGDFMRQLQTAGYGVEHQLGPAVREEE